MCVQGFLLTDQRATGTTLRQLFGKYKEEHGEAEHQLDLESIAFTIQR